MGTKPKIVFSATIALLFILGLLKLPDIHPFLKSCSGSFICGVDIKYILGFLGKADSTTAAFGYYVYQKIMTATIVFLITLLVTSVAHRLYTGRNN